MSEKVPHALEVGLTRRELLKGAAGLGAAAFGSMLYAPVREAYKKVDSIGNDYSNDPFLGNATRIERPRLDELLSGSEDIPLASYRMNEKWHNNPDSLAEFAFFVDEPGPIYAEFDGIDGDSTSLVLLGATLDEGEERFIRLIRDPEDHSPFTVQLGAHEVGRHQLNVRLKDGAANAHEIVPRFTRGDPRSFRSLVDAYQPIIYLRDYENITNNFPVRTLVFTYEEPDAFVFVFWKECVGEDKEYGRFGTSVQQLHRDKKRITDIDWDLEIRVSKTTGAVTTLNIAEPIHNRTAISTHEAPATRLRIASLNNNVRLAPDDWASKHAGIHIRPEIYVHSERWDALYSTHPAIARLSAIQHIAKGHLNPYDPTDVTIIKDTGLDIQLFGASDHP